jgi:hypothetical protein
MIDNRKYHYIYKTVNIINSNFYIGLHSTNNINDGYMGSGDRIRSSIRHYGKDNHTFEILEFLDSRDLLLSREREIVNRDLLKNPLCLNIMEGGYGFLDEEHMKKVSKAGNDAFREKLKDPNYMEDFLLKCDSKGKAENMHRIHIERGFDFGTFRNKKHTTETISKMKESKSGKGLGNENSQFGTCWINSVEIGDKKIRKEDLEFYLESGWKKGRIKKLTKLN